MFFLSMQLCNHCKCTTSQMFKRCKGQYDIYTILNLEKNVASAREWDFTVQMVWWYCVFVHLIGNTGISIWYLIGVSEYLWYKGACRDSQTDTMDAPLGHWNVLVSCLTIVSKLTIAVFISLHFHSGQKKTGVRCWTIGSEMPTWVDSSFLLSSGNILSCLSFILFFQRHLFLKPLNFISKKMSCSYLALPCWVDSTSQTHLKGRPVSPKEVTNVMFSKRWTLILKKHVNLTS